jgi:hypothetical protein
MHLLQPGLLWLALAAAGTPATPAEPPTRTAAVDISARGEPGMPTLGPLRRSLERFHASLSEVCLDAQPQAEAARDAPRGPNDLWRPGRRVSCLAAAQVTPTPPASQTDTVVYFVGLLVITIVGWLISKL